MPDLDEVRKMRTDKQFDRVATHKDRLTRAKVFMGL